LRNRHTSGGVGLFFRAGRRISPRFVNPVVQAGRLHHGPGKAEGFAMTDHSPDDPRPAGRLLFVLGWILAVALLAALAECFLRLSPPTDLHPYLGEASPLTGSYRPDHDFGVTYSSWEAFRDDNAKRLTPYLPLDGGADSRPTWAFFGNSFVQAPGMFGDTAAAALPDHRVFYLGRNEPLFVRLAQIKLLLEHGLAPERIFIELMPVDVATLGEQPLETFRVTSRGALTFEPNQPPGPAGWPVRHSRLGLTAWCRAGLQKGNRHFSKHRLYEGVDPRLLADLRHLFGGVARAARDHGVPVTVMLIPAYHQVSSGASFGFQDALAPAFRDLGLDVFDPRAAFLAQPDKPGLFIPDLHFSARGNHILLDELLRHVRQSTGTAVAREP
jgi:hypothetical protein